MYMSFQDLCDFVDRNREKLSPQTPVYAYSREEEFKKRGNWTPYHVLWERHPKHGESWDEAEKIFQVFLSETKDGQEVIYFTPHY